MTSADLTTKCINTIRFLAVDAVQAARSGHPGAPLGAAAMAHVLWDRFLVHNPKNPDWPNRDRFVLSAGHASALLYALLYLNGYDLPLEDLKAFRQWGSKAAGHPEKGLAPGVETTTGPLGQGLANAIGMAIAERWLAARYNRPGHDIIDHHTYCIVSDGDLEEGISNEAASLAGTLGLGRLTAMYDSNGISIEGSTDHSFTEDVAARFRSLGWQIVGPIDGMAPAEVEKALDEARTDHSRPSLVICRTIIGFGSPNKANSAASHGEPLGEEETRLTKEALGWKYSEPFTVPDDVLASCREAIARGAIAEKEWNQEFESYARAYPDEGENLKRDLSGALPRDWEKALEAIQLDEKPTATRATSGKALNALASQVGMLMGGSADLAPSNKSVITGGGDLSQENYGGRNMHFGVRENAMGSICNGIALHGGAIPYAATFLVFYDYMRPAVRLAALMGIRTLFLYTHDSIGVGEDGPTHQPIEHILGLRSVPNLTVIRPADAAETIEAWKYAVANQTGPTALVLTRQNVPNIDRSQGSPASELSKGAYIVHEPQMAPAVILIATGSEVHVAMAAAQLLDARNIPARVVSMPSWELFEAQSREYCERVLPSTMSRRLSVEAGSTIGWAKYLGSEGVAIGIDHFGSSAPGGELFKRYGFTAENVAEKAIALVEGEAV